MDPRVSQSFAAFGLPITADRAAVKAEYRRLALLRHPDKVPVWQKAQAQEDMKVLNAAYETLCGYLYLMESAEMARNLERERWQKKKREREEREAELERSRLAEEEKTSFAESRREYVRLQQKRTEERRRERDRVVDGEEEVRKMKAAWQQQYAEAGIWLAEKRAPAGADRAEEEGQDEDEEVDNVGKESPNDGKIRFSLRNLKK